MDFLHHFVLNVFKDFASAVDALIHAWQAFYNMIDAGI